MQSRLVVGTVQTKSSAIAFAFGARTGVYTIRMPSLRNTSSKGQLYLLSRSSRRTSSRCQRSNVRGVTTRSTRRALGEAAPALQTTRDQPDSTSHEDAASAKRRAHGATQTAHNP